MYKLELHSGIFFFYVVAIAVKYVLHPCIHLIAAIVTKAHLELQNIIFDTFDIPAQVVQQVAGFD